MKKIVCSIAIIASMVLASSCGNRASKNVEAGMADSTLVDSTVVDSTAVEVTTDTTVVK